MDFKGKVIEEIKFYDDYINMIFTDGTKILCSFHTGFDTFEITSTIFINDEYRSDIII